MLSCSVGTAELTADWPSLSRRRLCRRDGGDVGAGPAGLLLGSFLRNWTRRCSQRAHFGQGQQTSGQAQPNTVFIESAFTGDKPASGHSFSRPDAPPIPSIRHQLPVPHPSQLVFNGAASSTTRRTGRRSSTTLPPPLHQWVGCGQRHLNISCFSSSFCGSMGFAGTSSAANSTIATRPSSLQRFRDRRQPTIVTGATGLTRFVDTAAAATHYHHQPAGETRFEGRASPQRNIVVNNGQRSPSRGDRRKCHHRRSLRPGFF